jgi:hypothetical protein
MGLAMMVSQINSNSRNNSGSKQPKNEGISNKRSN